MRAAIAAAQDVARHGEHVASLLERRSRGDERTALLACLDDDDRARQSADDAVAKRKEPRLRRRAGHALADDRAVLLDVARERRVLGRIDHVKSRSEHGDGDAARRQRAAMRRGIDAARETADDRHAARC